MAKYKNVNAELSSVNVNKNMLWQELYFLQDGQWLEMIDHTADKLRDVKLPITVHEDMGGDKDMMFIDFNDMEIKPNDSDFVNCKHVVSKNGKSITKYYVVCDEVSKSFTWMEPILYRKPMIFVEPAMLLDRYLPMGKSFTLSLSGEATKIDQVIDTLLEVTPLRAVGEKQIFHLDERIRAKLQRIEPHEFMWDDGVVLGECLKDIGTVINGRLRLIPNANDDRIFDTVTYGFYDEDKGEYTQTIKYNDYEAQCELGATATEYVTVAENIVAENSAFSPGRNAWTSCRYDELKTKEDGAYVEIGAPVYKINKVMMDGVVGTTKAYDSQGKKYTAEVNKELDAFDITKYVLPLEKFNILPKAGGKSMKFAYDTNRIIEICSHYNTINNNRTWENIAENYWLSRRMFKEDGNSYVCDEIDIKNKIEDLRFNIEYTPMPQHVNIVSKNSDIGLDKRLGKLHSAMSGRGGSALKMGVKGWSDAQRLGNTVVRLCADYEDLDNIPELGQRYKWQGEEYVICKMQYAYTDNYIVRLLIEMSKNFTRLNENIGLNKKYRQFEIPQDITSRTIHKDIEVHFSKSPVATEERLYRLQELVYNCFGLIGPNSLHVNMHPIAALVISTRAWVPHNNTDEDIRLLCPTMSLNLGYSAMYKVQMTDNMVCGRYRHGALNYDAYYCTLDGKIADVSVELASLIFNNDADKLPMVKENSYFSYYNDSYKIEKDSGEALSFEMQIHFISNEYIISPKLTKIFMNGEETLQIRRLNKNINAFTNEVVTISDIIPDAQVNSPKNYDYIIIEGLPNVGKGWAITDSDGRILLAENIDLSTLNGSANVYISVKY